MWKAFVILPLIGTSILTLDRKHMSIGVQKEVTLSPSEQFEEMW